MYCKKIFCIITEFYKPIFRKLFLPSFKKSSVECCAIENKKIYGNYFEDEFKKVITYKIENIIQTLLQNKIIIWSDVDIVFPMGVDPVIQDLEKRIQNFDLLISRENNGDHDINSGFFIAKKSNKTIDLFQNLLNEVKQSDVVTEQPIFKDLLHESDLNWNLLPRSYWNLTIGPPWPKKLLMIHANHTPSFNKITNKKLNFKKQNIVGRKEKILKYILYKIKHKSLL